MKERKFSTQWKQIYLLMRLVGLSLFRLFLVLSPTGTWSTSKAATRSFVERLKNFLKIAFIFRTNLVNSTQISLVIQFNFHHHPHARRIFTYEFIVFVWINRAYQKDETKAKKNRRKFNIWVHFVNHTHFVMFACLQGHFDESKGNLWKIKCQCSTCSNNKFLIWNLRMFVTFQLHSSQWSNCMSMHSILIWYRSICFQFVNHVIVLY